MSNRTFHDGENFSLVKEPESVEEEVINDVLTKDFDGEVVTEEELDELLGGD